MGGKQTKKRNKPLTQTHNFMYTYTDRQKPRFSLLLGQPSNKRQNIQINQNLNK